MARIKLKFYDKEYIIEYKNRSQVKEYFADLEAIVKEADALAKDKNVDDKQKANVSLKGLVILIKAGLVEHHADDMPSDEDIDKWTTSIPNTKAFYEKLMSMIQEVIDAIDNDTKNLNWEVEED